MCELARWWLPHRRAPWVLGPLAAAAVGICLVLTFIQVSYWKDTLTLFNSPSKRDKNYFGYNHIGKEYDRQSVEEARAAQVAQARGRPENVKEHKKRRDECEDEAIEAFSAALKIDPRLRFRSKQSRRLLCPATKK